MLIDVRVTELLISKICHDLISPVSAINNGVELIEDIGGDVVAEAMKLIGNSASQSSRRLKFFRLSYGRAGSEEGLSFREVIPIAESFFEGSKIKLEWPNDLPPESFREKKGGLKCILNMILLGEEMLPYGGIMRLAAEGEATKLIIQGRAAELGSQSIAALEGSLALEDLTPKLIQGYVAARFADHFGFKLSYKNTNTEESVLALVREEPANS